MIYENNIVLKSIVSSIDTTKADAEEVEAKYSYKEVFENGMLPGLNEFLTL